MHKGFELLILGGMVPAVRQAAGNGSLVVIDEIGLMEMPSDLFCRTVVQALTADARVLGSIVGRSTPFGDRIQQRKDVQVVEVYAGNREALVEKILALISGGRM